MLLNLVLLFLVFGAAKKKISPYLAAILLGVIEAVIHYFANHNLAGALVQFGVYAVLAAGLVYFLARLDRKPATGAAYRTPGTDDKVSFQWEYIPLVALILFLIFGETVIRFWMK